MGLGILDADRLAAEPVVACGAAKKDLFAAGGPGRSLIDAILKGESLALYAAGGAAGGDPIAGVMVEGKASIGRFGGALRRLIYGAESLTAEVVQDAQCLTERITQQALSVKAGQPPLRFADFERELRRLLRGEPLELEGLPPTLRGALEPLAGVGERLRTRMGAEPAPWLAWLRNPHELAERVRRAPDGVLRLPRADLRLWGWCR
jgi:hypothetical protein